jgi:Na+/melibiose symporter-like transporter
MFIAIIIIALTSIPLGFLEKNSRNWVYLCIGLEGVGLAIILNTATQTISDVIGKDSENSAFVYGCYSLLDKFANGGLLFFILQSYSDDEKALRLVLSIIPLSCAIVSFILTYIGAKYFGKELAVLSFAKSRSST